MLLYSWRCMIWNVYSIYNRVYFFGRLLQAFLLLHFLLHKPPLHAELLRVSSLLPLQFVNGSSSMKHSLPALTLMDVLSKKADKSPNAHVVPTYLCIELHKMKSALVGGNKFLATTHHSIWPILVVSSRKGLIISKRKKRKVPKAFNYCRTCLVDSWFSPIWERGSSLFEICRNFWWAKSNFWWANPKRVRQKKMSPLLIHRGLIKVASQLLSDDLINRRAYPSSESLSIGAYHRHCHP